MDDFPLPTNETAQDEMEPVIYTALDAFMDIVIFLVIITCVLIIFTISINKRLQTKTYWIFINWSANEILFLIFTALREVLHLFFSGCFKIHIDILFPLNCTILILMIISNTLINGNYSLKLILGATYATTLLLFAGLIILCKLERLIMPALCIFLITNLILLITVLVKECNKCKKMKTTPLREKTVFRLNLARIFIYNFFIIIYFYVLFSEQILNSQFVRQLAMVSYLLTPVYLLIYIMVADKNFKTAVFNVFRKSGDREMLDADNNLTDDDYALPTNV